MSRRRIFRLIQPRIQLRLILSFAVLSTTALLLQHLLFMKVLAELAERLPQDGAVVLDETVWTLVTILVGSFLAVLPVTFLVGLAATHRWVGPLYRIERFLREVAAGGRPGDCRLRAGDELQDLCDLVNRVTRPLREADQRSEEPHEPRLRKAA